MFDAATLRALNTLYGFVKDGELLCVPCGSGPEPEKRGRALLGVDLFNAGQSIEDVECENCGESVSEGEVCCTNVPTRARFVCSECGRSLKEEAES